MKIDATEIVTDVSKPFTGTLADAWQSLLGDRISHWRLQNAARLQIKTAAELAALGLKTIPENIPERYAFAWFEEATKQDEDEIQTLFARLLAKAAAGDEEALDRRLLGIVSQMVPSDAAVINFIFKDLHMKKAADRSKSLQRAFEEFDLYRDLSQNFANDPWRSVEHLMALGVFERQAILDERAAKNFVSVLTVEIRGEPELTGPAELEVQQLVRLSFTGCRSGECDHADKIGILIGHCRLERRILKAERSHQISVLTGINVANVPWVR